MNLRRGDLVKILIGKDKGKTGKIMRVDIKTSRVIVDGLNLVKKHQKPNTSYPQGGIIEKSLPIDSSNVGLICNHCQKITRVGYKITGENKNRVCKKCQEILL